MWSAAKRAGAELLGATYYELDAGARWAERGRAFVMTEDEPYDPERGRILRVFDVIQPSECVGIGCFERTPPFASSVRT